MFALGLRQFALSEWKSNLANYSPIIFCQICAAGEIHFLGAKIRQNRSNYNVSGIMAKLFKNARQWCLFHADIVRTLWFIQVWNLKINIFLSDLGHIFPFLWWSFVFTHEWMNEWMNEYRVRKYSLLAVWGIYIFRVCMYISNLHAQCVGGKWR